MIGVIFLSKLICFGVIIFFFAFVHFFVCLLFGGGKLSLNKAHK